MSVNKLFLSGLLHISQVPSMRIRSGEHPRGGGGHIHGNELLNCDHKQGPEYWAWLAILAVVETKILILIHEVWKVREEVDVSELEGGRGHEWMLECENI